jgi:leader peptidase (prepilin peptidase) / N-methyltransferase
MPVDGALLALTAVFGLLVGSFLNVVIYRLPKMMERQWRMEAADILEQEPKPEPVFNLVVPRSRCPHCGHQIQWFENIPVLSFIFLRGKCSKCGTPIGVRYPIVELASSALVVFCVWRFGLTATAGVWSVFCLILLAAALIDWDTTLLPDDLMYPLLWAGLLAAALGWNPAVPLPQAVWGATLGYLSLWSVYWAFKLITGKEGMGYGDFKLFAALGAWFGAWALIPLILMASVVGAVIGIGLKVFGGLREGGYMPFGPFLAGAGLVALVVGPQTLMRLILPAG